jgi:hypothetical protein
MERSKGNDIQLWRFGSFFKIGGIIFSFEERLMANRPTPLFPLENAGADPQGLESDDGFQYFSNSALNLSILSFRGLL